MQQLCGVYRPPKKENLNNYLQQIVDTLDCLNGEKILIGDMNIDLNKCNDRDVQTYVNTMTSIGLSICNNNLTRESSNAILDHVYTNMETQKKYTRPPSGAISVTTT